MDLHGCAIKNVKIIYCVLLLLLCSNLPVIGKSPGFLIWVSDLNHVFEFKSDKQSTWMDKFKNLDMINGSFFKSNSTIVPPYATQNLNVLPSKKNKWWYIEHDNTIFFDSTYNIKQLGLVLKSPKELPDSTSKFRIAVCPPMIDNFIDVDKKYIYRTCGKKFALRNCRRTMIGKTKEGEIFIFVGTGNVFKLRELLKRKIDDIVWLANLDGGSSSFLTLNNSMVLKNKTKIPSIITFKTYKLEMIK